MRMPPLPQQRFRPRAASRAGVVGVVLALATISRAAPADGGKPAADGGRSCGPAPAPAVRLGRKAIDADLALLKTSTDRERLERAARDLAASADPAAIRGLGRMLAGRDLLARLDDLQDPSSKTRHLGNVLAELARHPSAETGALAVALANSPDFLADDDRRIDLLPALAAVRPMTAAGADVLRRAAAEGYVSTVIPLLAQNGSPQALALFEALVLQPGADVESRVADIHASIVPCRSDLGLLRSVEHMLSARDLDPRLAAALFESLFDDRSREWFGPARRPPTPPAWEAASTEAIAQALRVAALARRHRLPPPLAATVERAASSLRAALARRKA